MRTKISALLIFASACGLGGTPESGLPVSPAVVSEEDESAGRWLSNARSLDEAQQIRTRPSATSFALLSWTPPTKNEDGSALTDLAGYKIFLGSQPGVYPKFVEVNDPKATSYRIENLPAGQWYFSVRSVSKAGVVSAPSSECSKLIQ